VPLLRQQWLGPRQAALLTESRQAVGHADCETAPESGVAHYQYPNPLDLLYLAADAALHRPELPGSNVHLVLELAGALDVAAFTRAVHAAARRYPIIAARRELNLLTSRPRWRLDPPRADERHVIAVEHVTPATREEWQTRFERMLLEPLDAVRQAPMQFRVFRGLPAGDVLVARWPHGLMDARAGAGLIEEIDRLYTLAPDRATLTSAGDEERDGLAETLAKIPVRQRLRLIRAAWRDHTWRDQRIARLTDAPLPAHLGALRFLQRRLPAEDAVRVRDVAVRVCGLARLGDYLRACAIRALHESMPTPPPADAVYTTMNFIDRRGRKLKTPGCHNLFNVLPAAVPVTVAHDRRLVADAIRDQMLAHLQADTTTRDLALLWGITRAPTAWLARIMRDRLRPGRTIAARPGAPAPSLPFGFMAPSARTMPTYCGVPLTNYFGCRPPPADVGYALEVNMTETRLNATAVCFENRVSPATLGALLDRFVVALLELP
jgi:hypothetical protein